jgi:hypothetical protein
MSRLYYPKEVRESHPSNGSSRLYYPSEKSVYIDPMRIAQFSVSIDLDGVLADYESGIRAMGFEIDPSLNRSSHLLPGSGSARKRQMYEAIKGTTFYANLPLMPGAVELYNACFSAHPIILTAAPKFGATEEDYFTNPYWLGAAFHKRNWVETVLLPAAAEARKNIWHKLVDPVATRYHIPDDRFICTTSARKHEFMHRKHSDHQILIDDRTDNIEAWKEAGGIGILHTSVEDTLKQLAAI